MAYVRDAAWQDFYALSRTMRACDVQEVEAATGLSPLKALASCYFDSPFKKAICGDHGELLGLFGVAPDENYMRAGKVWMLATDALQKYARPFLRECGTWIKRMHDHYPLLHNVTDERNTLHHRWLRWCGFTFIRRVDLNGHPFLEFVRLDSSRNGEGSS